MNAKRLANFLLNDFKGIVNKHKASIADCGISPDDFRQISQLLYVGAIDKKQYKEMVEKRIIEHKEAKCGTTS